MKTYLHAYAMCQSMFCAIPCPWNIWDEDARKHMLLFLPVVGLVIGLLWWGSSWILGVLGVPDLIRALVLCAYPFLCTGFIHLDGFMDVTDAVKSCRDLPRRREILKDSHVGSFSVIGCVLLMLAQFSFFACVPSGADLRILIFIPVVSRCCSALAVTSCPHVHQSVRPPAQAPFPCSRAHRHALRRRNGGSLCVPPLRLVSADRTGGLRSCPVSQLSLPEGDERGHFRLFIDLL